VKAKVPAVRRGYDLLKLRGWRTVVPGKYVFTDDDDLFGLWLHPRERPPGSGPPPVAYSTESALEIQLLNDRVEALEREGWEVDVASVSSTPAGSETWLHSDPYLVSVQKMRSPHEGHGSRALLSLPTAWRHQQEKGWTQLDKAPEIPAIWDRHQCLLVVWCSYCEAWHRHGSVDFPTHMNAGCVHGPHLRSPYLKHGYLPVVMRISLTDEELAELAGA
jgi:hypothetical protein